MSRKLVRIGVLAWLCLMLVMASCKNHTQKNVIPVAVSQQDSIVGNLFRYAKNVVAFPTGYGYLLEVLNPWDSTAKLGRFALVDAGHSSDAVHEEGAVVVQLPVQSVISFSSTQWSVFLELGEIERVKGILEGRNIHCPEMHRLLAEGVVKDVGTESAKNMELMISMHPDIILYSPYFDGNQEPLSVTGAALFPFADYLESTPLGRAEWIRVVGLLSGCSDRADAWFDDIERRYNELKDWCADVQERPTVFSDLAFNGQWYVAGGKSYIAQLFEDAGADYIWKDDPSTASFPLDSETILAKAQHADFWRIANSSSLPMTYERLKKENAVYALFDAYKRHKIIVCDIQDSGYFETSQIEPDILLADFICCFHPEIMAAHQPDYRTKYYRLLK
ncbi:MAG: ABC transporter substrate-binding protein [Bacteroidales bacterium]|nr:ABC transporter substrate-binding protein [Bacteroidales bacterium]